MSLDLARAAVELLEHALGREHVAVQELIENPLPRGSVGRQRDEERKREGCELAEREQADEQQIE